MAFLAPLAVPLISAVASAALSFAISRLTAEDNEQSIVGPRLNDLSPGDSEYGKVIPFAYGTIRAPGNLIWADDLEEVVVVDETDTGGKGGPSQSTTTTTFFYFCDFRTQFAFGFPPAESILRIFMNGQLVYDATVDPVTGQPTSEVFWKYADQTALPRFYNGDAAQLPDPIEEQILGVGNAPAYRYTVSIFFERLPLADFGNRIPLVSATIAFATDPEFPQVSSVGGTPGSVGVFGIDRQRGLLAAGQFIDDGIIDIHSFETGMVVSTIDLGAAVGDAQILDLFFDEASGLLYVGSRAGPFDYRYYKFEPNSGELLATSENIQVGGANTGPAQRAAALTRRNGINQTFLIAAVGAIPAIVLFQVDPGFFRYFRLPLNAGVEGFGVAAITDRSGFVWILTDRAAGGSPSYLIRCEPVLGPTAGGYQLSTLTTLLDGVEDADGMAYDPITNSILVSCGDPDHAGQKISKFDIASMSIVASVSEFDAGFDFQELSSASNMSNGGISGLLSGALLYVGDSLTGARLLNVATMTFERGGNAIGNLIDDFVPAEMSGITPIYYDARSNAVVGVLDTDSTTSVRRFFLERVGASGLSLETTIRRIAFFSGVGVGLLGLPDQVDATDLAGDTVEGFIQDSQQKAADIISLLAAAYDFEVTEIDGMLKFVKKPGATIRTLTLDDLSAEENEPLDVPFDEERIQDVEIPVNVDLSYYDLERDYQKGNQSSKRTRLPRSAFFGDSTRNVSLPLAFTATQARQIVERLLFTSHNERQRLKIQLSLMQVDLDPTDCIALPIGNDVVKLRIISTELGDNGVIIVEGVIQEDATFTSTAISSTSGAPGQALVQVGNSDLFIVDTVLLRDADNPGQNAQSVLYPALSGTDDDFRGGIVYRRDGSGFRQFDATTHVTAYGFAITVPVDFEDTAHHTWDREDSFTVVWSAGEEPTSETEENVLRGSNAFLVGQEIIQAATVVDNMDGTLTFSDLLRGRRGSEAFGVGHNPGERVLRLDSRLHRIFVPATDIGVTTTYRHVPFGRSLDLSGELQHTHQGNALKPLRPYRIRTQEDTPGMGDLRIEWLRQTRVGGATDLNDGVANVPEIDQPLAFELHVMDDPEDLTADAVRSFTGSQIELPADPNAAGYDGAVTYLAADRATDSQTGTVNVRVFQISPIVGRGFPADASSDDPAVDVDA